MRIGNVQPGRPEYYDRNPVGKTQTYAASGVAPHGSTQRWAYTVPSNTKAYCQSVYLNNQRSVAAAPAGPVGCKIALTPFGDAIAVVVERQQIDNAVGPSYMWAESGIGLLTSGDLLECDTNDASTGGTIEFRITATLVQFDA